MKRSDKFHTKDFEALGYYDFELQKAVGKCAKQLINTKQYTKAGLAPKLQMLLEKPTDFIDDEIFGELAKQIIERSEYNQSTKITEKGYDLQPEALPFEIYGTEGIEPAAVEQMRLSMRLPITCAGALMPDAHFGYGLPIGGVLATQPDRVIPFAVGVDIACRMCLSVFEADEAFLQKNMSQLKRLLGENTSFGTGKASPNPLPDAVFDLPDWSATKLIRSLRPKAEAQIGTSGTGNHFVEWGIVRVLQEDAALGLPVGVYLALLSHSGSRGFGATIAGHYTKIAMDTVKLPKEAQHLAWLDTSQEAGAEYWLSMNLAGAYASANHHQIHRKMARSLNMKPLRIIENHHNFAWKEKLQNGSEVIVHRKGATPAAEGVLGIIPGSMAQSGFVVKGKGNAAALQSASHGAGRAMSRSQAFKRFTQTDLESVLRHEGITLLGGDLDEAPMVYKNIHEVIAAQSDLIEVLAEFAPRIVRMADREPRSYGKKGKGGELDFTES